MPGPQLFAGGRVEVRHGDCLDHMRGMADGSIDAVVTDPPYALAFMGREWDRQPSPQAFEAWCEQWAAECLRVVKPGGYLASFGGTRTYHRLTCGIEDAGWYVTDAIGAGLYAWTHGQGFPKGKSQLKPAWEPITIARRPAAKVQPLGIDACRVAADWATDPTRRGWQGRKAPDDGMWGGGNVRAEHSQPHDGGRWPTNLVLVHHPECVEVNCHPQCHVAALDGQSGVLHSQDPATRASKSKRAGVTAFVTGASIEYADRGGASRFYPVFRYQAKASRSERPQVDGRGHPTVKPLALMAWLVRLVCPPDGTVLDPFAGSGTTLQAARDEGMRAVGVEADEHSVQLIAQRLATAALAEPDLFTTSAS